MAPKKKSNKLSEAEAAAEGTEAVEETAQPEAETAETPAATEETAAEEAPMEIEPEKPKVPEKPKELEEDAPADSRKKLGENAVAWNMADCTLNVLPAFDGKLLSALSDNGFQHLLASVRGNTGIKAGRYMFEAKVMEQGAESFQGSKPIKNVVRVGLALAGSSLLSDEDMLIFDNEGFMIHGKKRVKTNQKFIKGCTVALVVNMDAASANADTVSVFVNGNRVCQPQKLPEEWKGKALFPIAVYRNVTLQVNFGPRSTSKMPFACRMLSDAAKADVEVAKAATGGQPEVLLPVGLPEQGVFDWVDDFLAKNPSYTELSPRKMLDWGVKSGLIRKGGKTSLDHPEMGFQIPQLDDFSVLKMAKAIAPFHKGNFVVMEMKSNLVSADRKASLDKFPGFKKRAAVLMGAPSAEYKNLIQGMLLDAKKTKAEAERKRKAAENERKKLVEERQKKLEAAKKARLAGKKEGEEPEAEEKEEEKAAAPEEPEAPVTLTDEEKAVVFRKLEAPDMVLNVVTKHFADFTLPAQAEGFDAVDFVWQNEAGSAAHLQEFVLSRKLTSRVESLKPGDWFNKEWKEWQALLGSWRKRQGEWKNPNSRKGLLAKIAADKKAAKPENGEEGAAAEDNEPMKIDASDLDPFNVEEVMDIGSGEPLFANFAFEDWMLLSLRFELHLLVHAFKKDMNDPERAGFHESHLAFYYNKYFHKNWSNMTYGLKTFKEVTELIKENISLNKTGILEALMSDDVPSKSFVHLVEEQRRDRQRRVEAGVESAELKFQKGPQAPAHAPGGGQLTVKPAAHGQKRPFSPAPIQVVQQSWGNKQQRIQPRVITPPTASWQNKPPQRIQPIQPSFKPAGFKPAGFKGFGGNNKFYR